ncbi:hypothetical protein Hanom_Chr03g00212561 [Helianthus anomalus]
MPETREMNGGRFQSQAWLGLPSGFLGFSLWPFNNGSGFKYKTLVVDGVRSRAPRVAAIVDCAYFPVSFVRGR